jgi:hypothetical protein
MRNKLPITQRDHRSKLRKLSGWRIRYALLDAVVGTLIITQPALFAELIYPSLTPHGVLLAVYLLGWLRLGRFLSTIFIPSRMISVILPWLWISSAPLHSAGLLLIQPQTLVSTLWHGVHLLLIARLWRGLS